MSARRIFALLLACVIVHACGGGSDDKPDMQTQPVHAPECQASAVCL